MADDLQAEESTPTSPAADKPVKKAAAKKAAAKKAPAKKAAAKKAPAKKAAAAAEPAAPVVEPIAEPAGDGQLDLGVDAPPAKKAAKRAPAKKAAAKKASTAKTTAKKTAAADEAPVETAAETPAEATAEETAATALLFQAPVAKKAPARRTRKAAAAAPAEAAEPETPIVEAEPSDADDTEQDKPAPKKKSPGGKQGGRSGGRKSAKADQPADEDEIVETAEPTESTDEDESAEGDEQSGDGNGPARRRRRRGGRRRRKPGDASSEGDSDESEDSDDSADEARDESATDSEDGSGDSPSSRRRRRRRRSGDDGGGEGGDDPANTVTRVRRQRSAEDEITSIQGSTRLEAKKQRRREGREAGRRRAPIVSEAEFLARRESVDRVMVVRQREDLTQIGVLEDKVLVEHYVARASQTSLIGNVYLGRVQNVLPSMEAAFIDIGKGRNAVLYAGEVNWSALGHKDGQPRKIESVLSSGQTILVQVSKDPIGHKGARLTSQISLAGRFLVYVPDGTTSGISRKLPDTERNRLKTLLKEIVPDTAGVIVRTAAEGASEEELTRDVERLKARWEDIEGKVKGSAPQLLYGEPDLTLKVVRDLFTEDFTKLVIQGDDAWDTVQGYVAQVAPDLEQRLERYEPGANGQGGKADVFAEYRIEEQIAKGLDRKVWLPSGGSLVIDRTEAMTVVDVNTGKFTGSGGNLEETVTKNNLEAAEEIVRQLRLRDIGGIIVVDFIDMVLESNRDLVLRRLIECLGRDRTRHQVAEVTSLGLVQMTRKRIGTGLVEAFSENCSHCQGRGLVIHDAPVAPKDSSDDEPRRGGGGGGGRRGRGRGRGQDDAAAGTGGGAKAPSPKDVAAMARPENAEHEHDHEHEDIPEETPLVAAPTELAVEASSVEEAPVEEALVEEALVEETAAVETLAEPEADPEPAPPKVTTRSRRRSAPRPAAEPAPVVVLAEPQPVAVQPVVEPPVVDAVAEPVAAPEPPKVVTRTRGRSATRPAGPPAEVSAATTGDEDGDHAEGEHPHVEHVPIKKKGSRKR
ncbi:hypothetical protein GCM10023350_07670 [Nocardioides endophyticus]|uniref:S1 motif domain-containing protein n=1 Tax=Nocardioides endophyticus TaxID=1353775 RepID=A0ABP8YIS7_9ACTN